MEVSVGRTSNHVLLYSFENPQPFLHFLYSIQWTRPKVEERGHLEPERIQELDKMFENARGTSKLG
jgi:hypothetical protein